MTLKRKAAQTPDADTPPAPKRKTVSGQIMQTDTLRKVFRSSDFVNTRVTADVREKNLLYEIGEQFYNTSKKDGPAFLRVLVGESEKLRDVDLRNIAEHLKISQEWTTFISSVGNSKPNEAELVGAISALARILENQTGPSKHKFTRRGGDNAISDADLGSNLRSLKPDIVMIKNADLTTITNRDVLTIVESKNYSTTTKIGFRRLYANTILKATHVLNDGIERKYTLAIFVLKLELLVAVVDRSGALLFKLSSDFSVDPTPFVNFFAVCLYNSPANLGLRPELRQLGNGLIEMNVGGKMIQARVDRVCMPSKDHLIGRATTIRRVSYEGDFPKMLVKSSWQLLGDVKRPKESGVLEMLAHHNVQNIQKLVCYSTGDFNTQCGRRGFKAANLVLMKDNPDLYLVTASSTKRYGSHDSDFSALGTSSKSSSISLSTRSTEPPLNTEQKTTALVQRSDSLSREYEVLVTLYCGCPVNATNHMDGSPITHAQRYRALAAALNGYLGAYDIGLLHRDISPGNIAITPPVKSFYELFGYGTLLDFDHARFVQRDDKAKPEQTGTGFYMATIVLLDPIIRHLAWYDFESFFWVIFLTEIDLHREESPDLRESILQLESSSSYKSIAYNRLHLSRDDFKDTIKFLPPAVRHLLIELRELIFRPGEGDKDPADLNYKYEEFHRFQCLKKDNVRFQGNKIIELCEACAKS